MLRCEHGVYIPRGCRGKNPYCTGCTPAGTVKRTRAVNLPLRTMYGHADGLYANGISAAACPKCHSAVWCETKKRDCAECAECGTIYKRRMKNAYEPHQSER